LERNEQASSFIEKAGLVSPDNEYLQSTMAFIVYIIWANDDAKSSYQKA
jgi:Tfp pilus assembly protein PilF